MVTIAIPNTGTTTSMGKIGHAINNVAAGSQQVSIGNTSNVVATRLNSNSTALGISPARSPTATTTLTSVFGGRRGPFNYS